MKIEDVDFPAGLLNALRDGRLVVFAKVQFAGSGRALNREGTLY